MKSEPVSGNRNTESALRCFICEVPDEEAALIEQQAERLSKIHVCQTCKFQLDIETRLLQGSRLARGLSGHLCSAPGTMQCACDMVPETTAISERSASFLRHITPERTPHGHGTYEAARQDR